VDLFVGTTRRWTGTKETRSLIYDCYVPMALKEMNRLVEVASEKWPVSRAIVHHRLGTVEVCEISVIIGISTAHRKDAFEACRWLIDSLKNDVPIWKKEVYADGTEIWIEKTEN